MGKKRFSSLLKQKAEKTALDPIYLCLRLIRLLYDF